MSYGDLQFIDILIFAGVAAFLIYRLKNVLGKRTGFEKNSKINIVENETDVDMKPEIPQLKENEEKLELAYKTLLDFDHKNFLEGAKFAFETIINAFNNSDRKTLKNLLTNDVYKSFDKTISDGNNDAGFQFYSLKIDGVLDVVVINKLINITLKIASEQFKDNDESKVIKKQDIWTFQKKIDDKSPIWLLSSTQS